MGEVDVPTRGDCVARVFCHDLDIVIHLLSPGAMVGTGRGVNWRWRELGCWVVV